MTDLLRGDIPAAIDYFKDNIGTMPKLILLDPRYQQPKHQLVIDEIPKDIKVEFHSVLAHEVRMAVVEKVIVEDKPFKITSSRTPEPVPPEKPVQEVATENSAKITPEPPTSIATPIRVFAPKKLSHKKSEGGLVGRPAKDFPVAKILKMFSQDIHEKEIRRRLLSDDGIKISRRTLFYIKAGQRQLV